MQSFCCLDLRDFHDVHVLGILILGNMRGGRVARLKNFADQVIAVEVKTSGAVDLLICRRSGAAHRGRKTENLLHEGEATLRSNDTYAVTPS